MNAAAKDAPSITVILDRLRSAHNTGNIFRLAESMDSYRNS